MNRNEGGISCSSWCYLDFSPSEYDDHILCVAEFDAPYITI
jgi:hypothetical protein